LVQQLSLVLESPSTFSRHGKTLVKPARQRAVTRRALNQDMRDLMPQDVSECVVGIAWRARRKNDHQFRCIQGKSGDPGRNLLRQLRVLRGKDDLDGWTRFRQPYELSNTGQGQSVSGFETHADGREFRRRFNSKLWFLR